MAPHFADCLSAADAGCGRRRPLRPESNANPIGIIMACEAGRISIG
jgi:hypothetical protein